MPSLAARTACIARPLCAAALLLCGAVPALAATPSTAEEVLRCMQANQPARWSADMEVTHRGAQGGSERRHLLYARRPAERGGAAEHWVRFIEPVNLRGVTHLYRPRTPGWDRYSYLPALGRVTRVTQSDPAAGGFDEVVGLDGLDALMRWPAEALLSLGEVTTRQGREVRVFRATRRIGTGGPPRFEKVEGWLDSERCLPLEASFSGGEGPRMVRVDPAGIVRRGDYWIPTAFRMEGARGEESAVHLRSFRVDPVLDRRVFDVRRFHTVEASDLGLEAAGSASTP